MQEPNFNNLFFGDVPNSLEAVFLATQKNYSQINPLYFTIRTATGIAFYNYSFVTEKANLQLLSAMFAAIEAVHSELKGHSQLLPSISYGDFHILNKQINDYYIATLLQQNSEDHRILQRILFGIKNQIALPIPPVYNFSESTIHDLDNLLSQYAK